MKKTLSIILSLIMVITMLSGCGATQSSTPGDALFKPGTYTGEGKGFGGTIKVEVEVSESEILKIDFLEHGESAGISDAAFEKIPAEMIEFQTIAVDTVSGATMSSKGIIEAVTNALSKTATDISKLQVKVEKEVSTEKIEETADVVIIGSGGAGMSAAVEAINAGSSVIIIEKQSSVGGNTILAGSAMNSADPERQTAQKMSKEELKTIESFTTLEPKNDEMKSWQETLKKEIEEYKASGSDHLFDSPSLHKLQTYADGDYVANPKLIGVLGENALSGVKFLEDLGTKWLDGIQAAVGATWKRSHTPTTDYGAKGASFVMPQTEFVKANGGTIMLESKAEEFIVTDGVVTGVKGTKTNRQPFEITANKGVILATGGFGANVEMRQKYNKHWESLDASINTSNGPQATGDGIVMAEGVNANLVGMEWIQLIPTYGPGVFTPYIENQFYINKEGNRFVAEDGRRDVLSQAILQQTDKEIFIISDVNTVKDGKTTTGTDVDARLSSCKAWKADTLEELAEMINVPYENLKKSVDQFNNSVKNGKDPLGRTVFDKEFGVGPFYAGLTSPMVHHTMGGIEINENAEVIDANGNVIPGLFAAGEVTGGIHGSNRLGGNAIADIVVFGRIAGRSASSR